MNDRFLRVRRLDSDAASINAIDTIRITYPPPLVTISNLITTPSRPVEQDPVAISATVSIQSVPDTFALTNYWREWPSTSWTNWIAMTSTNPTLYTATNIPGKAIGTMVEYYARATYTADGATYSTNSNSTNTYVVIPKSSYTNLSVIGDLNSSLSNGASYLWQGVIQVTNNNPPTFQFRGISNATTTTWGDLNQTVTNIPLYGFADVTTSNITLNTTNNGAYLFAFTETNLEYSVRSCTYENFNTWTNIDASTPPHTNNTGWILFSGNTSNDTSRIFSGIGRSAIIETNGWLQTPYLSNGVGQVSLWYRNWSTTGAPTGKFQIQVSTNAVNWDNLANAAVSNIVSTNYLFFSSTTNDIINKYVRILNTNTTTRLCLDEVVIAQAGSFVSATNLTTTPINPTILDPITIAADLTPYNGASISNVIAWYRAGTNGQWIADSMTNTGGGHYVLSTVIIGLPQGSNALQYAVQCFFSGYPNSSSVFFSGGTNNPASVTISEIVRQENFDINWPGAPWAYDTYRNATNAISGWSIASNSISADDSSFVSTPNNACFFGLGGASYLQSPYLTNGIGAVIYSFKNSRTASGGIFAFESSADGTTWTTNSITTNRNTSILTITNIVSSMTDRFLRIRRLDSDVASINAIDTIRITYPPANVAITNVYINPGYPVAGQIFTGSCDVITLNPYFPAYNITPTFNYWLIGGSTSSITMSRDWALGTTNHFSIPVSLGSVTRDMPYGYNVSVTFDGYYGSTAEKQSPKTNSPSGTFTTRAYASSYQDLGVIVNGSLKSGRLLADGIWQAFFTVSSSSNLAFMLNGSGYSSGAGYSTNAMQWGNSNNWQTTTTPLVDLSYTGQASFSISGASNAFSGQYVLRFDERTGQYIILKCVSQDFDGWTSDDDLYKFESKATSSLLQNNFNDWTTNSTQTRVENFSDPRWGAINYYTNYAATGPVGYGIFVSKISGSAMVTTNPASLIGGSFVVQGSQLATELSTQPLKGIGTISFKYNCSAITNNTIGVYLYTNAFSTPDEYALSSRWIPLTNSTISNTTVATYTVNLKTSPPADVIIAHTAGKATVTFDDLTVSEWYADSQAKSGWVTSEGWIEQRAGITEDNYCLRFDTSRADPGSEEFVMTPMLNNGVGAISFNYCCASSNTPVSYTIASRTGLFGTWSNLVTTTASNFNGTATDYRTNSWLVSMAATNTFLKIIHTNLNQGVLLIDDIKITGASVSSAWEINNAAIDDSPQPSPPLLLGKRQFYAGFSTLNKDRTSNLASGSFFPNTNTWPYIVSPILSTGIGEISFWYRNWTTNGAVTPARLIIQTTTNLLATTNDAIWSTVAIVSNIVNTNDYQYYQYIGNNYASRYARIYNDDQYTSAVGRVCIDDILVAEPLASTLSMSNLVITPSIPLYTNTVKIATDIYKLFLAPSNITLTAYYATATTYAALSGATPIPLGMSCISTNPSAPGQWYRYQTTNAIPTNAIDTFVKYYVQASYQGYQAASTSPRTNATFPTYPAWYAPMDAVYTNGIAYYVVYSCPTGAVWINEINAIDVSGTNFIWTNEFIEVCGKSGVDIRNWKLEVYRDINLDSTPTYIGSYLITNGAIISNAVNGYGFWLLGATNILNINQPLTITVDEGWGNPIGIQRLPYAGGLILKRSWGAAEQKITYNTTFPGFFNAGYDWYNLEIGSLALTGTAINAFSWAEVATITPGATNYSQTFPLTMPTISIFRIWINTNTWIECSQASGWQTMPWVSTNLSNANGWTNVPVFQRTASPTSDVINFSKPTNSPAYFYKVVATNGL